MFKRKKKKNIESVKTPWYKIYGDNIPRHLVYPECSIYDFFDDNTSKYDKLIAYDYFGTTKTFYDFKKDIELCACAFKSIGVSKGDIVTICMPNMPEAITAWYGLNKIGAISNMIHPLSAEEEIKYYLNLSQSKVVLSVDLAYSKIKNIIDKTDVEKVILVSAKDSMPKIMQVGYDLTKGKKIQKPTYDNMFMKYKDFIDNGRDYIGNTKENVSGEDICSILYSGGTTGNPRGVMLSNNNFNAVAVQNNVMCGNLGPTDSIVAIMPIFHGFGLGVAIHTVMSHGAKAILMPQFNVDEFYKILKHKKPTTIVGVPTLFEGMISNKKINRLNLSHLRICISGGDSLSNSLRGKIDDFLSSHHANTRVREGYGMTESVCASCLNPIYDIRENSIGIPYPDTYYKIVTPGTHTEVPYGEEGEICISGPTVMMGYLDNIRETNDTLQTHEDGRVWLHTGDGGYMDEDGYVYFKLRLKRLIVSSGYNIYPQYVEDIIESHPSVLKCTVIGIPHPYKMQVAKAYIVLKNGVKDTDEVREDIYNYCLKNIAKFSMPYVFEYRKELPKTLVGKVAYRKLMDESEKDIDNL